MHKKLIPLLLASLFSGCYSIDSYIGDGELADNGYNFMGGRYILTLGEIPLNINKKYHFNLSSLPPHYEFTVGLMVEKDIEVAKIISSNIKLELLNEDGKKVISESAPFNKWTLSHGDAPTVYAYIRGKGYDNPIKGSTKEIRIYSGVDCGWGTYFIPRRKASYVLTIEISPTGNDEKVKAILILKDVGNVGKCA